MRRQTTLMVRVAGGDGVRARHYAIELGLDRRELARPYVHVRRPDPPAAAAPKRARK